MKKSAKFAIICCAVMMCAAILSLFSVYLVASAEGEYTRPVSVTGIVASVGDKSVTVYSDPVDYYEDSSGGYLTDYSISVRKPASADNVMYTPLFPNTTTGRDGNVTEYVCEMQTSNYVVTKINNTGDGTTYIPVGGFVLSLNSDLYANFANIGDIVTLSGNKISIATKAVESTAGKRVVVDNTNTTRSGPMVVYYDYQFGAKTGTNVFGTEMTCVYSFEENTFKVQSFRGFGAGDDSGSEIPDNSFVLSAYGEGYRQLLVRGQLFSIGDSVKMVGFDFIRFGGTVYGEYDYVNPTEADNPYGMEFENVPFPAYRGTDQTIIYKYGWSYGNSTGTGTNIYGYEAAVDADGVVVELGVNVSKIPENGYVISGHGKGRDFIRSNMVLGATVELNETTKTYSISTTLNSYYENLVTSVESAVTAAENRIKQLYDVDSELIGTYIEQAREQLTQLKTVKEEIEEGLEGDITEQERLSLLMNYNNFQLQIERLQQRIVVMSAESKAVSARAVWHRPVETNYNEILTNVEMYKSIGINMVFVETLYNGYSAFRSDVAEFPYNIKLGESFVDGDGNQYADYLSAFTACCKLYGIQVHAWVENFYISTLSSATVLTMHPDWIMYNDDGTIYQRHEGGAYIFIDPANKDVQDTLISYYNDLFKKIPDVAGLNLDYIRYPVSDMDDDVGFTVAAMTGFYQQMGKTFSDAQLADRTKMANKFKQLFDTNYLVGGLAEAEKNYAAWVQYRTDIVTSYVKRIKTEVKDANNILLSTSVFASLTESKDAKKQDWKTWFSNGWIDIATPMAYYTDATDVNLNVGNMIAAAGNNCYYYSGLASSFSGLPAWRNKEQIEASYLAGANGYVIFCSTQILGHEDVQEALLLGVNSKQAILPHADVITVLNGYFDDILDKSERLYIAKQAMTAEQRTALQQKFQEISEMSAENAVDIYKIQVQVSAVVKNISTYAKGYARARITEQLNELVSLLDNKISMQLIADNEWDPEVDKQRPIVSENGVGVPSTPAHTCQHACPICGKCTDTTCTDSVCLAKCQGHEETPGEQKDNTILIVCVVSGCVGVLGGTISLVCIRRKKKSGK